MAGSPVQKFGKVYLCHVFGPCVCVSEFPLFYTIDTKSGTVCEKLAAVMA